jgi:hypothetical protein
MKVKFQAQVNPASLILPKIEDTFGDTLSCDLDNNNQTIGNF